MKTLMVVDMQKGFINDKNKFLIDGINDLTNKRIFDNIILTKYKNKDNSPFKKILNWDGMCDEDSQNFVINCNGDIIEKFSYGLPNKTVRKLKNDNISEIYLCGTDIDACVLNIAFNLFDNNIKPVFIKELCGTSSNNGDIEKAAWLIIERNFGNNCICSLSDLK